MAPRVRIIVPTFNYAHFLGDALDGVVRQTIADWECVVVDDGSTDNTPAVADEWSWRTRASGRVLYPLPFRRDDRLTGRYIGRTVVGRHAQDAAQNDDVFLELRCLARLDPVPRTLHSGDRSTRLSRSC